MGTQYSSRGVELITISSVFLFLSSLCVALRVVSRRIKRMRLEADDYWIFVALFFALGNGLVAILGVTSAGTGQHMNILDPGQIVLCMKLLLASELTWAGSIAAIKFSLLCLYRRLFPQRKFRIVVYIVMGITGAFFIATAIATLLQCRPIQGVWDMTIAAVCDNQLAASVGTGITNVVTDMIVLALPIPLVWNLKLRRLARGVLVGIFGLGFFVCIISIIRIISISEASYMDFTYDRVPTDIYSVLEPTLGIICACLAIMRPLFERLLPSSLAGARGSAGSRNRKDKKSNNKPTGNPTSLGSSVVHKGYLSSVTTDDGLDRLNTNTGYGIESTESMEIAACPSIELDSRNIKVTRVWDVERQ